MRTLFFNTIAILCVFSLFTIPPFSNSAKTEITKINLQKKYSDAQIETFIREVFQEHADELVLKSTSGRLELIKDFLNRFEIEQRGDLRGKKMRLLSTISLSTKYNPNLTRDNFIDTKTFNPLKYNLPMNSKEIELFRIDNTDYIIRIFPKN